MVWNGTNVSIAQRSLRSRVTLCDTSGYTRMKSRTNVYTAIGHLPSRAHWQRTSKHIQVLKSTNVKSVKSYSLHRAASRSISDYILVSFHTNEDWMLDPHSTLFMLQFVYVQYNFVFDTSFMCRVSVVVVVDDVYHAMHWCKHRIHAVIILSFTLLNCVKTV